MAQYESDITQFIRNFLEQHPEELASQKKGRSIWWDKSGDDRSAPPPPRHSPKAGGNEYTFRPLSERDA